MADREELFEDVRKRGLARVIAERGRELVASPEGRELTSGKNLDELIHADPELQAAAAERDSRKQRRFSLTRRGFVALSAAGLLETQLGRAFAAPVPNVLRGPGKDHPTVREGDGSPMRYYDGLEFQNWGRTVRNTPAETFSPRSKEGVRNLVKWASENGKRVRAGGYRHSWSDVFSDDDQIFVSMLPPGTVEDLPTLHPPLDPANDLMGIQMVGTIVEDGKTKGLCKLGAATTNEQFRQWCMDEQRGNWEWTVPLNVIMVEITWGGSNAPICHGAGIEQKTLSDLVHEIEFVNVKGELQTVSDPKLLRAASGCFGLLGIVTSITLKLDPMTFATLQPEAPRLALAIPPPEGFEVPAEIDMSGITDADLEAARQRFVQQAEEFYYTEWFWFPYQQDAWVNCWQNDGAREDAGPYPGDLEMRRQEIESYMIEVGQSTGFKLLPGRVQAEMFGSAAMASLPRDVTVVTPLIEALHFRRGIHNFRVMDMELEIPIPPRADDPTKPDWSLVQRAWWDVIKNVYERPDAPMRVALELRIMGGSDVTMAPQEGNDFGTCSIEVLTTQATPRTEWNAFIQDVANLWTSYTDHKGKPLNVRPHWAKQWEEVDFRGQDPTTYLRDVAYEPNIKDFAKDLKKIAKDGGYDASDLRMFSNQQLDALFGAVFA